MNGQLQNPVFEALRTRDRHLSFGTEKVKYFDEAVSPFVGMEEGYPQGFADLLRLLPPNRRVLFATPHAFTHPGGWQVLHAIPGVQMIHSGKTAAVTSPLIRPLQEADLTQMLALTLLTKPGPFGRKTPAFGHYHGIFMEGQLVAMTGQRLHLPGFTELSAVCTHPDHLGKGYASLLVQHGIELVLQQGDTPFLHVRKDNERAIAVYQRLGFAISREMNFYVLQPASKP